MSKLSEKTKWLLILQGLVLFMSLGGVFSKSAAQHAFMSWPFIAFYAAEIVVLFVYAIMWQQVLKRIPLTVAFCNKAVGMIWSTLWGVMLFGEIIKAQKIIGVAIVIFGVLLVVKSDE